MKNEKVRWEIIRAGFGKYPLRGCVIAMWFIALAIICAGLVAAIFSEKIGVGICTAGGGVFLLSIVVLFLAVLFDK
jgi:hypothetical protein